MPNFRAIILFGPVAHLELITRGRISLNLKLKDTDVRGITRISQGGGVDDSGN